MSSSTSSKLRVGIDFDNTIIDYRQVFKRLAVQQGWVPTDIPALKEAVKAHLVAQDGNDLRWQQLQAWAYGHEILSAVEFQGFKEFLSWAKSQEVEIHIVSQKSEFSHFDPSVNLREWAKKWIAANRLEVIPSNVFFEDDREKKIARIESLRCDVFIDDLKEVLEHPGFPKGTMKLWFAEGLQSHLDPSWIQQGTWSEITRLMGLCLEAGTRAIWAYRAQFGEAPKSAKSIKREGNNRIIRFQSDSDRPDLVLKWAGNTGSENRASLEFEATKYLWSNGIRKISEPLALDAQNGMAFYSHIAGRGFGQSDVSSQHLDQAVEFLCDLKKLSLEQPHGFTEWGRDSRPTLRHYPWMLEKRLKKITEGLKQKPNAVAEKLIYDRLVPIQQKLLKRFERRAGELGLSLDQELKPEERILSPSDFGFHNAILAESGQVVFFDFEYFGWDDPAKLLADFCHSLANPIGWNLKKRLIDRAVDRIGGASLRSRWALVVDLIGLEWVLIALNVLDPEVMARRVFANPTTNAAELVQLRISRASDMILRIEGGQDHASFWTIPEEGF